MHGSVPAELKQAKPSKTELSQAKVSAATPNRDELSPAELRKEASLGMRGRAALIMAQSHHHGLKIVGVQEARTPGPASRQSSHYHIITSGANDRGQLGCELWISTELSFSA